CTAKLVHLALALLTLTETALAHLFHELLQLIAEALLAVTQAFHIATLALAALAPLILSFLKGPVAQLLLLADHVPELVQRRHHVIVAAVHVLTGSRRVLQEGLQLLQHAS